MTEQIRTLDNIIADIKGFGIEEFEEILTINIGGKKISLRISNISTEEELLAMIASEEYKGHMWVQKIKCEMLSRAISWIDGVPIKGDEIVINPMRDGLESNIRVVLRDVLMTWGVEVLTILWKIFMVHNQKIEDRLIETFPDSVIMTEFERRFLERALIELDEQSKSAIEDTIDKTIKNETKA